MKLKLFFSTFALIFFAELGDKTQLTALAVSATTSKWLAFAAAGSALTASTLIAVLFGHLLARIVPPRVIKLLSGLLFVVFGGIVLWSALQTSVNTEPLGTGKGFFGIFALVFLAELGDKTQLAAMAQSASGKKWLVFFAASLALLLSTAIAVAFGGLLNSWIDIKYIKLISAGMFLIFGSAILYRLRKPEPELSTEPVAVHGLLASAALEMAAQFEAAAANDYEALAEQAEAEDLKELFLALGREEQGHVERVRSGLQETPGTESLAGEEDLPAMAVLTHDVANHDKPVLEHAIEHEEATARFYESLARAATLPGLTQVFAGLAVEEHRHAARLREYGTETTASTSE